MTFCELWIHKASRNSTESHLFPDNLFIADLFIPAWTGGKDTALDITVVPLQVAMVQQAAVTPGHALVKAHERKMAKHGEACRGAGIIFKALPFETLGGWGAESVAQVKMIGSALARHMGGEEAEVIRYLV